MAARFSWWEGLQVLHEVRVSVASVVWEQHDRRTDERRVQRLPVEQARELEFGGPHDAELRAVLLDPDSHPELRAERARQREVAARWQALPLDASLMELRPRYFVELQAFEASAILRSDHAWLSLQKLPMTLNGPAGERRFEAPFQHATGGFVQHRRFVMEQGGHAFVLSSTAEVLATTHAMASWGLTELLKVRPLFCGQHELVVELRGAHQELLPELLVLGGSRASLSFTEGWLSRAL